MSSILKVDNVSFGYRNGHSVIKDFSYEFELGKTYVLTGQSGAGKTTLTLLLSGLLSPKKGKILFENKNIAWINKCRYRSRCISLVFQNYNLLPKLTAVENVMLALHLAKDRGWKKRARCMALLQKMGLQKDECKRRILKLSGGQQQRVAIARAISHNANVILADEPTGNLDEKNSIEIMTLFNDLAHNENKCVIIVSHSSLIADMADVLIEIKKGE